MLNTIYANQSQFTDLLNAIQGGDTTAIVTALGQIKTSIDTVETALGSLSADVTQDSTQWTALVNAISSGGGGGGGTIDIDTTQWSNLLTEIGKGDMAATATALNNIYTRLNSIGFNSTQWTSLINALNSLSLTYQSNIILGTNADGRPTSTSVSVSDFLTVFEPTISNITGDYFDVDIYKTGAVKHIEFNGSMKQSASTGWISTNITLPAGYRPRYQINRGIMIRQGANNIYTTIAVGTTGLISFNATAALTTAGYLRCAFEYI